MTQARSGKRAVFWPVFIVGLIGANMAGAITMVVIATSDRTVAVEPDYYRKALDWDHAAEARRASEALGWKAEFGFNGLDASGLGRIVRLVLRDRAGKEIVGAKVSVECFHQADASRRYQAELMSVDGDGYTAAMPINRSGLWEVRLTATRGEERFVETTTVFIASAAGDAP